MRISDWSSDVCSSDLIRDDVQTGATDYAATKGNMEGGVPKYTFGGRVEGNAGPVSIGIEAKRTGSRYYNDLNTPVYDSSNVATRNEIWGAKVPAYTVVKIGRASCRERVCQYV